MGWVVPSFGVCAWSALACGFAPSFLVVRVSWCVPCGGGPGGSCAAIVSVCLCLRLVPVSVLVGFGPRLCGRAALGFPTGFSFGLL